MVEIIEVNIKDGVHVLMALAEKVILAIQTAFLAMLSVHINVFMSIRGQFASIVCLFNALRCYDSVHYFTLNKVIFNEVLVL